MSDVTHRRYRNVRHRYLVDVVAVTVYPGGCLIYRTVTIRTNTRVLTWPVEVFLRSFEPVGCRVRKRTTWEILQEE